MRRITSALEMESVQGKDGWFFRTGAAFTEYLPFENATRDYYTRLAEALAERDVRLVFAPVPARAMVTPEQVIDANSVVPGWSAERGRKNFQHLGKQVEETGVVFANVLEALLEQEQTEHFFFKRDLHWRPEGARLAAEAIAERLGRLPEYEALEKSSFTTVQNGEAERPSILQRSIQRSCLDLLPVESAPLFQTELEADSLGGDALFGDSVEDRSSIALVGTSFSDLQEFNFDGFLSQTTGLEVANFAVRGGGTFTSILSYTQSPAFAAKPPRFIVWEHPVYSRPSSYGYAQFRQLVPAVKGVCEAPMSASEQADVSGSLQLQADGPTGSHPYVALETGSALLREIRVEATFADGTREGHTIRRGDRFRSDGRFFYEWNVSNGGGGLNAELAAIKVSGLQPNMAVNARLCADRVNKDSRT